jgi:glutamine synthetase
MLAYSARNRSASIRIPYVNSAKGRRIEVRFPDPTANPYLAFSAMLMAGLDGIQNKIHPGEAADKDLYDLPAEEALKIPTVASSLEQALDALDADRGFLTAGGVFTDDMIDGFIELKRGEVERVEHDHTSGRVRHVLQRVSGSAEGDLGHHLHGHSTPRRTQHRYRALK